MDRFLIKAIPAKTDGDQIKKDENKENKDSNVTTKTNDTKLNDTSNDTKSNIVTATPKKRNTKPKTSTNTTSNTTTTTNAPPPQDTKKQTLVSHFFGCSDTPTYKFLFEKEAADRAEEERKKAERLAAEEAILAEKRKQIQKAKLEAKKKREAERRRKEEEEWEEYLAMQEKTTKGIEIVPHLYLGSFLAAKNSEWLQEANITKIVNVTSEVPSYFLSKKDKEKDKIVDEKYVDKFIVDDDEVDDEDDDEDDDGEDDDEEYDEEVDEEIKEIENSNDTEIIEKDDQVEMDQDNKEKSNDEKPAIVDEKEKEKEKEKEIEIEMKEPSSVNEIVSTNTSNDGADKKPKTINHIYEDIDEEKVIQLQEIKYLRISIADSPRSKIEEYFQEAIEFINKDNTGDQLKSNVLIHCKQGRSRSPSIVIAYLMSHEKWTLEKSFNHISSVSPKNLTVNDGFKKKLMDFEMELFNSNSINFFDRSNRRANNISPILTSITAPKRIIKKKITTTTKDDIEDEITVDITTNTLLTTNLQQFEDETSTLDELKIVKRRKNVAILDEDDE